MRRSDGKILTSHGGNLPRPKDLDALIARGESSQDAVAKRLPSAVQEVVDWQVESGVDVVNDGEYVKAAGLGNYAGYIHQRVTGWETVPVDPTKPPKRAGVGERDRRVFPGVYESGLWLSGSGGPVRPGFFTPGAPEEPITERVATGPIRYIGQAAIKADVDALTKALEGKSVDGFVAALGPLSLGAGSRNEYYATEAEYMMAVAETMREEYKVIVEAGLIVQLDEPEFATAWQFHPDWSVAEYRKYLDFCVEVINHAIEGLPEEQVRFHMCWGSGHRPHTTDIELKEIADLLIRVNAQAYSVEAGNVRHVHEWAVWKDIKLPDGKILMPGVISHATDLVEHPEVVAERLMDYASVVGKQNLYAGTDCGMGSRVGHEEIVWAKLKAMSQGAEIASAKLWKHGA